MGLPNINISFIERAIASITRSQRGIVALILKESTVPVTNPVTVLDPTDIPAGVSEFNKKQIELTLKGYIKSPKKVVCYFIDSDTLPVTYEPALDYFEVAKFDYMAIPTVETDAKVTEMETWIKAQRSNGKTGKVVLPNSTSDDEGVINFDTEWVADGDEVFTTEQYCGRFAGLIAGTPLSMSITYASLPELTDCSRMDKAEMNTAIDAGKLIVFNDGEKVKVARGVNSLVTTTETKGNQFKKIKIVEVMDMIYDDVKKTAEDNYLGKYSNSYDNKCLLISAIQGYFDQLVLDGVLESGNISIDILAQRAYLKGIGVATEDMSDEEIKVYNTKDKVFLTANVVILDAIEEIVLPINI